MDSFIAFNGTSISKQETTTKENTSNATKETEIEDSQASSSKTTEETKEKTEKDIKIEELKKTDDTKEKELTEIKTKIKEMEDKYGCNITQSGFKYDNILTNLVVTVQ